MSEKNEVLTYKGHPLMRKDNLVYYGSMADEFIVITESHQFCLPTLHDTSLFLKLG